MARIAHLQIDDVLRRGDQAAGSLVPTYGNRLTLLEGTETFAKDLLAHIPQARHQINITEFAIRPGGPMVDRVTAALRERASRGIPITVQMDQVGSGLLLPTARAKATHAMIRSLEDAGIAVKIKQLTPGRGGLNDARFAVDHRKMFEIDGRVAYQGGVNLVDDWAPWHDVMVRIEGPAAAQTGALLAGRWRDLGGSIPEARRAVLHAGLDAPVRNADAMVRQLSNGNRARRELTEHFVRSVDAAQERVWITSPYLGDARVASRIVTAAERGVDVRLTLSPKAASSQPQDVFTDPLRRAWAHEIHDAGGSIHHAPEFTHAKAWLIDGEAAVGTFNLDRFSTVRNYENAVKSDSPEFVRSVERMFLRQQGGASVADDTVAGWRTIALMREKLGLQY